MGLKMNLRIITKNRAADPEIGFSQNLFQSPMTTQQPCRQRGRYNILSINERRYSHLIKDIATCKKT